MPNQKSMLEVIAGSTPASRSNLKGSHMNRFRWMLRRLADAFEEVAKFLRHHGKPCGNCGGCLDCLREERSAAGDFNR